MKKFQKIIIIAVLIIAVCTIAVLAILSGRVKYNPDDTVGNTAGNLMNNGMFAEQDGVIYFANPYDNDKLYSMNSDCSNLKKISDDSVSHINVCDNYVFYVRNNYDPNNAGTIFRGQLYGVVRANLNGKHSKTLTADIASQMVLNGNTIIYGCFKDRQITTRYLSIDSKTNEEVKSTEIPMYCLNNGSLYYSGTEDDHNIYSFNCRSGAVSVVLEGNTYLASMVGNSLYYIDLDNNYALTRYNTSTKDTLVLYEGRCINYNVYDDVVFFQTEDGNNALHRMNIDGTGDEIVTTGNTDSISCTSQYTFFKFFNQNILYRVPTHGSITVESLMTN